MLIDVAFYFIVYSFLGWCAEVVFAAGKSGAFVNRGFLNGPFCPIYGFGVLFVIFLLEPVRDNLFLMFVGSVLVTSLIELIGGYVLEKLFRHRWWNYSDMPLNIGGYICLLFSLMWGLACLVITDRIHPLVETLVNLIPPFVGCILLALLGTLFLIDTLSTVKSILKLNKTLKIIDDISLRIHKASDDLGEDLAQKTISFIQKKGKLEEELEAKKELLQAGLAERKSAHQASVPTREQALAELQKVYEEIAQSRHLVHRRLFKAFPRLQSLEHADALEKLKRAISKTGNDR